MRRIETKITNLLLTCIKGQHARSFERNLSKRDVVEFDHETCTATYYLWDSPIVVCTPETVTVNDCGYQTTTTKSRLNAVLRALCVGCGIYQQDFQWYWWDLKETTVWEGSRSIPVSV